KALFAGFRRLLSTLSEVPETSKRLQPFDEILIWATEDATLVVRQRRCGFIQRLALRFQVECQILVCCIDAHVTQPVRDGAEIDAGSEEMNRRAVSHAVWMEPLVFQGVQVLRRLPNALLKDQPHTKTRQRLAAVIEENIARLMRRDPTLLQIGAQGVRRLAPQR